MGSTGRETRWGNDWLALKWSKCSCARHSVRQTRKWPSKHSRIRRLGSNRRCIRTGRRRYGIVNREPNRRPCSGWTSKLRSLLYVGSKDDDSTISYCKNTISSRSVMFPFHDESKNRSSLPARSTVITSCSEWWILTVSFTPMVKEYGHVSTEIVLFL